MNPGEEALRALARALAPYLREELERLEKEAAPADDAEIDTALAELGWERAS